jgi:NAD(P)-dependent dehydrogenase (short-subunit alcohol dehydrogenase family)
MGVLSDIIAGFAILFAGKTPTDTLPPSLSYEGKTVLVTGATSGLGLETAIHYVNLRAFKVIITARTHQKGEKAKTEIEKRTGKKDVIYVMVLNMDEFEGVVHFVKELENTVSRIDIVLLVSCSPRHLYQLTSAERRNT